LLTSAVGALAALPDVVPFLKGRSQVYAVIRTGGKQYKVKVGDLIDVEKLAGDDGASLELEPLLVVDDDGNVTSAAADLAKAKVTASVVDHHRGKKIRVFTYKNKTRQRRTLGHRQSLTRLKVETIDLGARERASRSGGGKAKQEQQDKQEQEG
jgi:large subunit ribosomal protein L21